MEVRPGAGRAFSDTLPKSLLFIRRIFHLSLDCSQCNAADNPFFEDNVDDQHWQGCYHTGGQRQHVVHGVSACETGSEIICVHDCARPFITATQIDSLVEELINKNHLNGVEIEQAIAKADKK